MLPSLNELGIDADIEYKVEIQGESPFVAPLRIRCIGGTNGMLLFERSTTPKPPLEAISRAGFGYSFFSTPTDGSVLRIDDMKELLLDWNWTGEEQERPEWFV